MRKLTKLQSLRFGGGTLLSAIPGFEGLVSLKVLHANFAFLDEWPDLGKLTSVCNLAICDWQGPDLVYISNLVLLEELELFSYELDVLPDIQNLKRLRSLSLKWSNFKNLAATYHLTSLQTLVVEKCHKLECLPDLHALTNLQTLDVSCCDNLETLPDTHFPTTLKTLRIKQCKKWAIVRGLRKLTFLETLEVAQGYTSIEFVPFIHSLTSLRSLKLENGVLGMAYTVGTIKYLSQLAILKCYHLHICVVPDLTNFPRLKELKLHNCQDLKSVTSRGPLTALEKINLSFCVSLEEVPDLINFPNLEGLPLWKCGNLISLNSSRPLHALKKVRLSGCVRLKVVPNYLSTCIQKDMTLNSRGSWDEDFDLHESIEYWSDSMSEPSSDTSDEISDASDEIHDGSDGS